MLSTKSKMLAIVGLLTAVFFMLLLFRGGACAKIALTRLIGIDDSIYLLIRNDKNYSLQALLEKNPSIVNSIDEEKGTPLLWAAYFGREQAVKLLLEHGADINARVDDFPSPIKCALLFNSNTNIAVHLLKSGTVADPFVLAGVGNLSELKKSLQTSDVDVNHIDPEFPMTEENGLTLLHYAACQNQLEIADFLINNGVKQIIIDGFGGAWGLPRMSGGSALHLSVWKDHLQMAKLLIDSRFAVNQPNGLKETPLHLAAETGNIDMVALLLDNGADPNAVQFGGDMPLHVAIDSFWRVHNSQVFGITHAESCQLDKLALKSIMNKLINAGAKVNIANREGKTPLLIAAFSANYLAINILLDCGADINTVDPHNFTALHFLAICGETNSNIVQSAKLLIKAGIDIDAKIKNGKTALDLAKATKKTALVNLLNRCVTDREQGHRPVR